MKPEMLDESGRRKRKLRSPTGKRVGINERVLTILEMLHWFGDLPTEYLYQFTKHLGRDRTGLVKLLGDLFHEQSYRLDGAYFDLPRGAGLIDRPWQQRKAENPLSNELVHAISEHGLEVLKAAGRYVPNAFKPSSTWEHAHMQATIMASIALGAQADPTLSFIPQHEIIPTSQPVFTFDNVDLKPDGVCAVERDGRRFYLFIEADRDTEANKPRNDRARKRKGKYWIDTVRLYRRLIGDNLYKKFLGIEKGHHGFLLNVTVNHGHMKNMVDIVGEVFPNGSKYILSQCYAGFGENFQPPPVLPLLTTPWRRAGHPDFSLTK